MKEPQDAGKYQVDNDKTQGQVIGDNPTVHQHFYTVSAKSETDYQRQGKQQHPIGFQVS
jgi:hypothetical protein